MAFLLCMQITALSRTYLAHRELESALIIIMIVIVVVILLLLLLSLPLQLPVRIVDTFKLLANDIS